jgi:predicted ABC-type ATPase
MPNLFIIAGCNGAGKSTFSSSFLPNNLTSFDYDALYLSNYNSLQDSELRDIIAKSKTTEVFENEVYHSINNKLDFCYETNFDEHPLYWPEIFKKSGYELNIIFFCLKDQEIAKHRVRVRTEFKGHFVNDRTIDLKWKAGYRNFNKHFKFFDNILIVDNSKTNEVYSNILQIIGQNIHLFDKHLPRYFKHRLPELYNYINN